MEATTSTIEVLAAVLAAGGPYTMTAIMLALYWRPWGRVDARDQTIADLNARLAQMIGENTRAATESSLMLRELCQRAGDCPKK